MNSVVKKINVYGWLLATSPLALIPLLVTAGGVVGYILTPFAVPLMATMSCLTIKPGVKEGCFSGLWVSMIQASFHTGFVLMIVVGIEGYMFDQWTLTHVLFAVIIYFAVSFACQIHLMSSSARKKT
jgi:hypothetical protein